ncbi:hypothetical protein Q3G72_007186 [Acer saccharum]|nr:hypothetical protein Q3G72_007186 [Acer saccharum]
MEIREIRSTPKPNNGDDDECGPDNVDGAICAARRSDLHRTEERSASWLHRGAICTVEERSAPHGGAICSKLVRELHLTPINTGGGFSGFV